MPTTGAGLNITKNLPPVLIMANIRETCSMGKPCKNKSKIQFNRMSVLFIRTVFVRIRENQSPTPASSARRPSSPPGVFTLPDCWIMTPSPVADTHRYSDKSPTLAATPESAQYAPVLRRKNSSSALRRRNHPPAALCSRRSMRLSRPCVAAPTPAPSAPASGHATERGH